MRKALVGTLAAAAATAGCEAAEDTPPTEDSAEGRRATVVALVPDNAVGEGAAAAAGLAAGEFMVDGWNVHIRTVDDGAHDDARTIAGRIAGDDDVIAVIGGLSADVVRTAQPVFDDAGIPFVSPADEEPVHTRGADPASPQRPYSTYFRTSVPSIGPAEWAASYAVDGLGSESVAVVDAGEGDPAAFATAATVAGADVLGPAAVGDDGAVHELLDAAKDSSTSVIFVAGGGETAARLARRMTDANLDARLLGGPGLRSQEFVERAGQAGEEAVAVVPAELEPTENISSTWLADELAAAGLAAPSQYGAAAYDATVAVMRALGRCLPPADSSTARGARRGCVSELGGVSFEGLTGPVSFDRYGDRVGGWPRVSELHQGEWLGIAF